MKRNANRNPMHMTRILSRTTFGLAAVIAAVAWAACGQNEPDPLRYWIPAGREVAVAGEDAPPPTDELWAGISAYDARDLNHAMAYLRTTAAPGGYGDIGKVYLASAFTLAGRHQRALSTLSRLETPALPPPWRDEADWIRYIALSGANQEQEAARLLDELTRRAGAIGDLARERKRRISG